MPELPENVNFGVIQGRFVTAEQLDVDEPDAKPVQGTVTFSPSPKKILNPAAALIILPKPITITLDASGYFSVILVATNDPDLSPIDWTYEVVCNFTGVVVDKFSIEVLAGTTTNLVDKTPVAAANGTFYLRGEPGADGVGTPGEDGKSAYELAVDEGYVGTLSDWIDSLQGTVPINRLPAGTVISTTSATTRPSTRSDLVCLWLGADPGSNALGNDVWLGS